MANLVEYLEEDDFDVDCFVERLARQTLSGESPESGDDAKKLRAAFEKTIEVLAQEYRYQESRVQPCQQKCVKADTELHQQVAGILTHQKAARINYKQARRQMNHIVAKTTHLGDMLEAHHVPRSRLMDAALLIDQFEEVLSTGLRQRSNQDKREVSAEYAENILKLHVAASELLSHRYDEAKQKIADEYTEVEASLLAQMSVAQRKGDVARLREIVTLMSNFCGYTACVDQFIVNAQKKAFIHPNVFLNVVPLCEKVSRVAQKVFSYPEIVTGKFIDHVLRNRVRDYIKAQLSQDDVTKMTAKQVHLTRLAQLFTKTSNVCTELHDTIPMDSATRKNLPNIPRELFGPYLRNHSDLEDHCMRIRLDTLISAYYQSIGHQRKMTATSPLREKYSVIRRDIQSKINSKAATLINVAPSVKDFGGETYICEALAANTLQELREAFQRATVLLRDPRRGRLISKIWKTFLSKFVNDHLLYGVQLGIKTIPVCQDMTQEPKQDFLRTVYHTNAIFYLIEDLFTEKIVPLLPGPAEHQKALQTKILHQKPLEDLIRVGLKRSVKAYANWLRSILEKQKIDEFLFSPASPTSLKVVQYCKKCLKAFDDFLDGQNRENIKMEFGRRFHQVILRNVRRFHYSQETGLGLLCDVMEYRAIMSATEVPILKEIFQILHTLCTLLVEPPEKLSFIIEQELQHRLDTQIIREFVQLRQDCKSNKLLAIIFQDMSS